MKYSYIFGFSALLVLLTVFVYSTYGDFYTDLAVNHSIEDKIIFEIKQETKTEELRLWKNDEGKCFLFLPSYAKLDSIYIDQSKSGGEKNKIFLDGEPIEKGASLKNIELEKEYIISFNDKDECSLQFLQSANVATMYINTQTGKMDRIYDNKSNKEKASISLYTINGNIDYVGGFFSDSINCRGTGTFTANKKPFSLNLEKPEDLLGMGNAREWILLANAYDATNIRNKLELDFAKKTCLKWTPDCEYVDLYLNGEYNGLYLLCEKVEIGENRLNVEDDNVFLCKNEKNEQITDLKKSFVTSGGVTTEIIFPKKNSFSEKNRIKQDVQVMEDEILDKQNNSLAHIDLDSWVDKYLIDEITENIDSDFRSSFFYCVYAGKVPMFYAGPIWDYDIIFGNSHRNPNPRTFLANQEMRLGYDKSHYYCALYKKSVFFKKVVSRYKELMLPILRTLVETEIDEQEKAIAEAANQDKVRWNYNDEDASTSQIKNYLIDRMDFLNSAWIDKIQYHTLQLKLNADEAWGFYSVKNGEKINKSDLRIFNLENSILIDSSTGEEFDFSQPIFEDKALYANTGITVDTIQLHVNIYEKLVFYLEITILAIFLLVITILAVISVKTDRGGAGNDT